MDVAAEFPLLELFEQVSDAAICNAHTFAAVQSGLPSGGAAGQTSDASHVARFARGARSNSSQRQQR